MGEGVRGRKAVRYRRADCEEETGRKECFFFSSRRRHTRFDCDWSSDVCSSDLDASAGFWLLTATAGGVGTASSSISGWASPRSSAKFVVAEAGQRTVKTLLLERRQLFRQQLVIPAGVRAEERRVGKEFRPRWSP